MKNFWLVSLSTVLQLIPPTHFRQNQKPVEEPVEVLSTQLGALMYRILNSDLQPLPSCAECHKQAKLKSCYLHLFTVVPWTAMCSAKSFFPIRCCPKNYRLITRARFTRMLRSQQWTHKVCKCIHVNWSFDAYLFIGKLRVKRSGLHWSEGQRILRSVRNHESDLEISENKSHHLMEPGPHKPGYWVSIL